MCQHNMPTCQNLAAVQPLPQEQDGEEALCNLDITFMSMVPFGVKVLRVTMKVRIGPPCGRDSCWRFVPCAV